MGFLSHQQYQLAAEKKNLSQPHICLASKAIFFKWRPTLSRAMRIRISMDLWVLL